MSGFTVEKEWAYKGMRLLVVQINWDLPPRFTSAEECEKLADQLEDHP